jgi:hypothetical protein
MVAIATTDVPMPFVHVRSLPLPTQPQFRVEDAVRTVREELAAATAIEAQHITVSWEWLAAQAGAKRLVLADVHAPDLHPPERVEAMLESVAASVGRITSEEVFASFRAARSGQVYDGGEVVRGRADA